MRIIIFGGTGMVGQGALHECLQDPEVDQVVSVVRAASGVRHKKLLEIIHTDFLDFSAVQDQFCNLDACLYCLGISSSRMKEADYSRITYDFTMAAATSLLSVNPQISFVYVSGAGTDSTEHGRIMWARVKGKTENALLAMPFRAAYMFRPGLIQPLAGITSKTASYRLLYKYSAPLVSILRRIWPKYVTTTAELGQAMLAAAKRGAEKRIVETKQIADLLKSLRNPAD
jgi:uncharacterized protein YbjT (DUF2867 family)